jgi:hypothetical protein
MKAFFTRNCNPARSTSSTTDIVDWTCPISNGLAFMQMLKERRKIGLDAVDVLSLNDSTRFEVRMLSVSFVGQRTGSSGTGESLPPKSCPGARTNRSYREVIAFHCDLPDCACACAWAMSHQSPMQHSPLIKEADTPENMAVRNFTHTVAHVHFSKLWLRIKLEPDFLVPLSLPPRSLPVCDDAYEIKCCRVVLRHFGHRTESLPYGSHSSTGKRYRTRPR